MPDSTSFPVSEKPSVYVIHENDEWMAPLRAAFHELDISFVEWFIDEGTISLTGTPPDGLFFNRMSASSHTRSHLYAAEFTETLLAWLESHGCRIVNGKRALQLEVRKFEQYLGLRKAGVLVPETIAASGEASILKAANSLGKTPFIVKPNRGGKGLGVQLFHSVDELDRWLSNLPKPSLSLDGITLVQEYIKPANSIITRLEFINGTFYYAVQVDASEGFELCPADTCETDDSLPVPEEQASTKRKKFTVSDTFNDSVLIPKLEVFFRNNMIEIASAEFTEDADGNRYVYDLNMNTNYNQRAEREAGNGKRAMLHVASFLGDLLKDHTNTR